MSGRYDAIVIGAGHNGLTTAALLARQGRRVLVLEQKEHIGGLAAAEEFHPGFWSCGVFQDTTLVSRRVADELELARHGLRWRTAPPDVLALGAPGDSLLLAGEVARATAAIRQRQPQDGERYPRYIAALEGLREVLRSFLDAAPLDPTSNEALDPRVLWRPGLRLRRLGRRGLLEFLRLPPLCTADWLDEWFADDLLKAALSLPALASTFMGPRSPGGTALLLRQAGLAGPGVEGGGPALVAAIAGAARTHGAEIRNGAPVAEVRMAGKVQGVKLMSGETFDAPVVAASCHPQQLLALLTLRSLPGRLTERLQHYRSRGTTAQVLFALRAPLRFKGYENLPVEFARTGASMLDIERAFDAVKYGRIAERPVLEIHAPSSNGEARPPGDRAVAPAGTVAPAGAVASVLVHYAPWNLEPGWDAKQRDRLGEQVQEMVRERASGLEVVARRVFAPPDFEALYALPGGNLHHGDHALDQLLLRPAAGCVGYRTPIPGLYLCGSGSHPGGGLTCLPGALAARAILAD